MHPAPVTGASFERGASRAIKPGRTLSPTDRRPSRLGWLATGFAAVAGIAIVAALISTRRSPPDPGTEIGAPGVERGLARSSTAAGADGYTTWTFPSENGLLMLPSAGRNGLVWAGDMATRQLVRLNPFDGNYARYDFPGAVPTLPMGSATDDGTGVWLAQEGAHAIARFDYETGAYQEYPTPTSKSSPFGIAVAQDGRVWFTELAAHQIGVFDPASQSFQEYPLPSEEIHPYTLAVAPDGRVWFTTITTPLVGVLDPSTSAVSLLQVPDLGDQPGTTGISIASTGDIWFGTLGGRLGRVDPAGMSVTSVQSPAATAYGVAADQFGRVWLAATTNVIYAYKPGEYTFCTVRTGPGARWLTAAADGAIWVTEGGGQTNAIGRVSPDRVAHPCV